MAPTTTCLPSANGFSFSFHSIVKRSLIIGLSQDVLKTLNQLLFLLVVSMAFAWVVMAAFFVYHLRRPGQKPSLDDAIEMYELKAPREFIEPEMRIFHPPPPAPAAEVAVAVAVTAEQPDNRRQQQQPQVPGVIVEEYEYAGENFTVLADSITTKD